MADKKFPFPDKIPDKDALRRIGEKVRKRLEEDETVFKFPTEVAEIFAVGNFIRPSECDNLIRQIDAVAKPSQTYKSDYTDAYRTSYSGNVDPNNPLVKSISRRIDDLLGLNPVQGEAIQGQRYLPGQEFKPHFDWFHPTDESCWPLEQKRGGQRCYTAMAFLNEVEEGGHTDFQHAGFGVKPQRGTLLMWNNALPDGTPNEDTMHSGSPVVKGQKYVITKWYRVRKWG